MSGFTKGTWKYEEYIPEGVTINGKEYLVHNGDVDIALVCKENDARLVAAALEMYRLLCEFLKIDEQKVWASTEKNDPAYMMALVAQDGAVNATKKLIARIDGEDIDDEG